MLVRAGREHGIALAGGDVALTRVAAPPIAAGVHGVPRRDILRVWQKVARIGASCGRTLQRVAISCRMSPSDCLSGVWGQMPSARRKVSQYSQQNHKPAGKRVDTRFWAIGWLSFLLAVSWI